MGCTQSAEPRGEGDAEGGAQPLEARTPTFLSRIGISRRSTPRTSNIVPIPEGLFSAVRQGPPDPDAAAGEAAGGAGAGAGAGAAPAPQNGPAGLPARRRTQQAPKMHNTQTVRSLVNLKKHTLKIEAEEGAPGKFSIAFVADSTVPCRMKSKLTKREASLVIPFCGLDQSYCTPVGQGLNLGSVPEEELSVDSCTHTQVYPLVIRLQVVPVLWVSGTSYVLHEIFGIDRMAEDPEVGEGEANNKECVICMVEDRDTLALPCRHLCLCSDCAKALRFQSNKCPICRTVVQSLLQIKLGDKSLPQVQEAGNKDHKLAKGEVVAGGGDGEAGGGGAEVKDGEGERVGEVRQGGEVEGGSVVLREPVGYMVQA